MVLFLYTGWCEWDFEANHAQKQVVVHCGEYLSIYMYDVRYSQCCPRKFPEKTPWWGTANLPSRINFLLSGLRSSPRRDVLFLEKGQKLIFMYKWKKKCSLKCVLLFHFVQSPAVHSILQWSPHNLNRCFQGIIHAGFFELCRCFCIAETETTIGVLFKFRKKCDSNCTGMTVVCWTPHDSEKIQTQTADSKPKVPRLPPLPLYSAK